jgi:predicted amidophosphoribosyltransferase
MGKRRECPVCSIDVERGWGYCPNCHYPLDDDDEDDLYSQSYTSSSDRGDDEDDDETTTTTTGIPT